MLFHAMINILPLPTLLDPQGKAVQYNLANMGFQIDHVRIGKHITLTVQAENEAVAQEQIMLACKQLLVNATTETYTFTLHHQVEE